VIIVAGFISSGTRLLHEVVDYHMRVPSLHRSWPHWDRFWDPDDFLHEFGIHTDPTWILISRDPKVCFQSAMKAGHRGKPDGTLLHDDLATIKSWYPKWQALVERIPTPYHVQYETLVDAPRETIDDLAKYLGVFTPLESYPYISNGNSKWR